MRGEGASTIRLYCGEETARASLVVAPIHCCMLQVLDLGLQEALRKREDVVVGYRH